MTYEEAQRYVLELPLHTKKNAVEANRRFYEWLGEPGSALTIIHVAGTNGKGSVCAYLNSILSEAGYRVGMFTSPHLVDIKERFVMGNEQIGEDAFSGLLAVLLDKLESYGDGTYRPTFFETMFFLFMLWAERERPDAVLLECGMGGRADVTNVIVCPAACVITRIGLDHCEYLGNTEAEIAKEKAGIFKKGAAAICLDTQEEVRNVYVKKAEELSALLVLVSKKEVAFSKLRKNCIDFFMESAYYRDIKTRLNTRALYQAENALLAVRTIEQLTGSFLVTKRQIEEGLSKMRWEARLEEVMPDVFLDGAHNPDGIHALVDSLAADEWDGRRILLFGACRDKAAKEMVNILKGSNLFDKMTAAPVQNRRSLTEAELERLLFDAEPRQTHVYQSAEDALTRLSGQLDGHSRIYIAGSLYLAGEVKQYVNRHNTEKRI